MSRLRIALLAVGDKGINAARDIPESVDLSHLFTYEQSTSTAHSDDFAQVAKRYGAELLIGRNPDLVLLDTDLIFAVGWQFMIKNAPEKLVILHDSLLPRYRGFAPTVSALINGDNQIGVTALLPAETPDSGDILHQESTQITPPITVRAAFDALRHCYALTIARVCSEFESTGALVGQPQDEGSATYSHWLDPYDYAIDWSWEAERVVRHILAVSAPYEGALAATYQGDLYRVASASVGNETKFEGREPGKVIARYGNDLHVTCGTGQVVIPVPRPHSAESPELAGLRIRFADVHTTRRLIGGIRS